MVSVICCTTRQNYLENVFQNFESQDWKEKELIIVLNKDDMDKSKWENRAKLSSNAIVYQLPEKSTLGECLNFAIAKAKYSIIAKFDDDDYYAPQYVRSSMKTLNESKADVVGKRTVYMYFEDEKILAVHKPGRENQFVKQGLKGATLFFKKELCQKIVFPKLNLGEDTYFLRECVKNGYKLFSADKNNFVVIRTSKLGHHTWNLSNQTLLKKSSIIGITENFKPFIQNERFEKN